MCQPITGREAMVANQRRIEFGTLTGRVTVIPRGYDEKISKPRVYVSTDESFNLVEDLENRTRRPYLAWKPLVVKAFDELHYRGVLTFIKQDESKLKLSWSQYAGCSCPCSPGFILGNCESIYFLNPEGSDPDDRRREFHFDIYVTLKGAPSVDESKEQRYISAPRPLTQDEQDDLLVADGVF